MEFPFQTGGHGSLLNRTCLLKRPQYDEFRERWSFG